MYNSGLLILDTKLTKLHVGPNSKTFLPINLVMVSSKRAIMYLLIAAFNNISSVAW